MQPYLRRRYEILIKVLMETTPELWAMFSAFSAFGEEYINAHDAEIEAEVRLRAGRWHAPNPPSKEGFLGHYRALMLHDTSDRVSGIRCPTWIAVGTSDTVTPPSYSKRLNALIPDRRWSCSKAVRIACSTSACGNSTKPRSPFFCTIARALPSG